MTDILNLAWRTISSPFAPFFRPQPQYQATPTVNRQSQTQPQNIPPQPKTAMQRLVELNPIYASMNLTPDLVNAHLPVEEKLAQQKQNQERQKQEWNITQDAKKQRGEIRANQMQETQRLEYLRQQRYAQELASLEHKYQINQIPVQFA